MPGGQKAREALYYNINFFKDSTEASSLNINEIQRRPTSLFAERYDYYACEIFFFNYEGRTFFGRKILSQLHLQGQQKSKKCCQITAPMIIGFVVRHQGTEQEAMVFHKKLNNEEKTYLFNRIKIDKTVDLYYPFPFLIDGKEKLQPTSAWDPTPEIIANLDAGETFIREYTVTLLKDFNLDGKKIFDPACSTGKFLGRLKEAFPKIRAIGQDMHPGMITHAQQSTSIDEFHCGNSLFSPVPKESVDFVIFRFLNVAVVTDQQATELFSQLANRCKNGGHLIVFGHTAVHLSKEWFEMLGLAVMQSTAYNAADDSIYQYYVLQKIAPVPELRYSNFYPFSFRGYSGQIPEEIKKEAKTPIKKPNTKLDAFLASMLLLGPTAVALSFSLLQGARMNPWTLTLSLGMSIASSSKLFKHALGRDTSGTPQKLSM